MKLRNVIFYVQDINKSKDFYKKLDFQIAQDFGKFVSYETKAGGLYFSIMESDNPKKVPGKQVCTFWTNDTKALYEKLKGLEIEIDTKLYKAPFGETFAIRDIDGSKIEFVQS